MKLDTKVTFALSLTSDEFNLIGRALRGVLRSDEIAEAAALQRQMVEVRVSQAKQYAAELAKLEANLK